MALPDARFSDKSPLYERLADEIAHQIERGTFRAGERIPSVRRSSQQRGVSMTTVLQAYQLLEDRGLIEARPQSGYFVRCRRAGLVGDSVGINSNLDPTHVSIEELTVKLLRDSRNPDLVQFGAAIPHADLLPTDKLNRIMAALTRDSSIQQHVCGLPEGCEELRVQTAQRAFLAGCNLSPEDIIITSGCMEAVNLALQAVCKPGDLVAIESPNYFGVLQAIQSHNLRTLEIPAHPRTGISLDTLRFALDHHNIRAMLMITNFNNPLGSLMPDENKRELVRMLAERDIPLIEDDIHGELYFSGQRPTVAKSYDQKGLVLLCSSYSKDVSPSYRVGWIAAGRYKNKVEVLKMGLNLGVSLLPQLAIAQFVANGGYEHHLRRIRRSYAQKVASMSQAILASFPPGTQVTDPAGGFVLWVQMPEQVDSLELYRRALKAGITLVPGNAFAATPKFQNYIRLNAAYWSEETRGALERLARLVDELSNKKK